MKVKMFSIDLVCVLYNMNDANNYQSVNNEVS